MKKILFTAFSVLAFTVAVNAQEQGLVRLNTGLAFGSEAGFDASGFGINVGGEYFFTDVISAAPSYTYFFEDSEDILGFENSVRLSSINLDGRYYFLTDDIQVYGLFGIAFLSINGELQFVDLFGAVETVEFDDNETGVNFGGGIVYPLSDKVGLNGQLKYQTPGDGQLVINAGVAINLN
ncbi:MAG: outer membrane beta-barrel protein [Bacteroidota bacterium]